MNDITTQIANISSTKQELLKQKLRAKGYNEAETHLYKTGAPALQLTDDSIEFLDNTTPAQTRSETEETFVAPRIELERQLIKIWSEVLGIESIGIKNNFFDLGGNSQLAESLLMQIEKTFGQNLYLPGISEAPTVEQQATILLPQLLQQEDWSLPWNPLKPISAKTGSKPPIFIVNGGFVGFLTASYTIASYLDREQKSYSIHLRGLDGKQAPHNRIEEMAADSIKEIQKLQPEGPYFLVGLCSGGIVAFEIAQQLYMQGQKVALLALVNSPAPKLKKDKKQGFGKVNEKQKARKIAVPPEVLKNLPPDPRLIRVAKALYRATQIYEARVYPGEAILFQASEGASKRSDSSRLTWYELAAGGLEVYKLPGDRMSLYEEPNIRVLIDKLKTCLHQG